jgi:hypothetical protein
MATLSQTETPPALWNPNAAAGWSLLFSPAFGSYLHAKNAESLGRADEAKANWLCFYVSLAYLAFVLVSVFIPQIPEIAYRVGALGILVGWYVSTGKVQAHYVKEVFGTSYTHKGWTAPLLVAFGCMIGFVALAIAIEIAAELFQGIEGIG